MRTTRCWLRPAERPSVRVAAAGPVVAALLLGGCGDDAGSGKPAATAPSRPPGIPESANWELHQTLLAAKAATYDPSDGGGTAELVSATPVRAGETGEFVVVYRAGRLGIAPGGALHFQVSPFWGWSSPQTSQEGAAGYTVVTCEGVAATVETAAVGQGLLIVRVKDAPLREGESITVRYGVGGTARVDRYADDLETFHLWVDGDGDPEGTRRLVDHDIRVRVGPREASDLLVTLPSVAAVGESFDVALAAIDAAGNRAEDFTGVIQLGVDDAVEIATDVEVVADDRGVTRTRAVARETGIFYVLAETRGLVKRSNPIVVREVPRRMLWADLQIHSSLSDGTASPEAIYRYARDVAALDVAALTDHDHHGMRKLDEDERLWQWIREAADEFHDPGRFVTLLGYEWTSWVWGHRHVLFFDDRGEVFSNLDDATDTPQELWQALRGFDALTVPHHPAGGAQALDWSIVPDPALEPVVEIVSVHGSSEGNGGPLTIHQPQEGHFVSDALARGYRLGLIGSTDGHDGHPGLGHLAAPCGGVAALLTGDRTRAGAKEALLARRTYATSGERIYVEFSLGPHGMGSVVPAPSAEERPFAYRAYVVGTAPIVALDLIKDGALLERVDAEGDEQATLLFTDEQRASGDAVYLRVVQANGHAAWTSPIFTE